MEVSFGTEVGQWDRLTASRMRSKWANKEGAPYFAAPKPDEALTSAFDHVKAKSKQSWNALDVAMSSAGASAHAILSAESYLRCFLKSLPKEPQDKDDYKAWRGEVKEAFKKNVFTPIAEATSCLAAVVNNSVKEVRRLVVEAPAAKHLKSTLKDVPPSATSFFGNPTERINSAISNSFMLNSMGSSRGQASRFAAATRKFPSYKSGQKGTSYSAKSPAPKWRKKQTQSKKTGNDSRRSGRGGRSGQN